MADDQIDDDDNRNLFLVTSYDQSGGITAGQVNIGQQFRQLNDRSKGQLRDVITAHPDTAIRVDAVMGDGEAFGLAEQVKAFLLAEGHEVDGVDQVVYGSPVIGQSIVFENDLWVIRIGHTQQSQALDPLEVTTV